jgi:hypothetical protein
MQPSRPLLTIAIPTYNRCRYLEELLLCLQPQLVEQPRVELVISDNASAADAPCRDNGCVKQLTVAMVMNEVDTVIEQRRSGSRPSRVATPVSTVVTRL